MTVRLRDYETRDNGLEVPSSRSHVSILVCKNTLFYIMEAVLEKFTYFWAIKTTLP